MRRAKSVQTIGCLLKPVGANSVRPLQNQTNFCRKRGCTECPPTSLCRSAPTQASLAYGVPRNERSRVLGVRVREVASQRAGGSSPFQKKCYFPCNRWEQDSRPTLKATVQPSPPSVEGGGEPASRRESFKGKVTFPSHKTPSNTKIYL